MFNNNNHNIGAENDCVKDLNNFVACFDGSNTHKYGFTNVNYQLSEQSISTNCLQCQDYQKSLCASSFQAIKNNQILKDDYNVNLKLVRANGLSPSLQQSTSCQRIKHLISVSKHSLGKKTSTIMTGSTSNSSNKSPIFKHRLNPDNSEIAKLSILEHSLPSEPIARTDPTYSQFRRHSGKLNFSRMITPRPPIHANYNESSTSLQNMSAPNGIMPQNQIHPRPSAFHSCPTNNIHLQQRLQSKEFPFNLQSCPLQNPSQWHVPHQQHNSSPKFEASLAFSYECPHVAQQQVCSSPVNRLFSPSRPNHEPAVNSSQNAENFSINQESMPSQQKHDNFLNPDLKGNQWPHQFRPNHLIQNNLAVSSQAATSSYLDNLHQYSLESSSLPFQTELVRSPVTIPAKDLPCKTSSSCHEMHSNSSSFLITPQSPDISNVKNIDFLATKISRPSHTNQLLPICPSDSQVVSKTNLNKSLLSCQMRFEDLSKGEDWELMAVKLEKNNGYFHRKEIFKHSEILSNSKDANDPSEDGPGRANACKVAVDIQAIDKHNTSTLESSGHNNKGIACDAITPYKNISIIDKKVNDLSSIIPASRVNPRTSITSIKAKPKLIIKSVKPSNLKNCIASKLDASTVFAKPVVSVQTNREAGVEKVYIKQNHQSSEIEPVTPKTSEITNAEKFIKKDWQDADNKSDHNFVNLVYLNKLKPFKPSLEIRKPSVKVLKGSSDHLKVLARYTNCKHCGMVLELKNASHCFHCQKVKPCNDTITTKKNVATSSKSKYFEEKQDIIVELSKEQIDELKVLNSSDVNKAIKKNGNGANNSKKKDGGSVNTTDEPDVLILSSDDEEQSQRKRLKLMFEAQAINASEQGCVSHLNLEKNSNLIGGGLPFDADWDGESNFESTIATSIHIGNFEVKQNELSKKPNERVFFRKGQIQFEIKAVNKENILEAEWLKINASDIETIICHFGNSFPGSVIMVLMKPGPAEQIKKKLGMTQDGKYNFDPLSSDLSERFVILKLHNLTEFVADGILKCFDLALIKNIEKETMNNLLIKALSEEKEHGNPSQTLLIYPPPPNRGGITITTKDYYCLEEGQFLNDVILDFYLKYLILEKLSKEDKERTHLFSTFFYKRLTSKPKMGKSNLEKNRDMSPAEIRHARVKSWTKNVDIFEKDFIIIPINERSHWFLAVVCFPRLVASTPVPLLNNSACTDTNKEPSTNKPIKVENPKFEDIEWSDKDEAESEDEELVAETDDEPQIKRPRQESAADTSERKHNIQFTKQPCILIFDSLAGSSRARIVATLRDYLSVEYFEKKKIHKIFSKDLIKGGCLNVPQQNNFTDCGIFTLQFAESFFENPLKSFQFPIPSLKNWFAQDRASSKREYIARKIEKLIDEFNPNKELKFMKIIFAPSKAEDDICSKFEKIVPEKLQRIENFKYIKSEVAIDADSVNSKKLQISKVATSKEVNEVFDNDIQPVLATNTLPRIPKRPLTPGPYQKPEPKYQTPLAGLYGGKNSVLQRSIESMSISIIDVKHSSVSNNNNKYFKSNFASNVNSHFSKPTFLKGRKSYCKATATSCLEGGGANSKTEEDEVIFENEVLKPKFGFSPNSQ